MDCFAAGLRAGSGFGFPAAMAAEPPLAPPASGSLCMRCEVRAHCLGGIAAEAGTAQLQGILSGRMSLRLHEVLYRPGEAFEHVYAVRSGVLRSTARRDDGEQVVGFHFPGELVGVDGMAAGRQRTTVMALGDAQVCVLRFAPRAAEAAGGRAFLARLWDMMSCELLRERAHQGLLATLSPPQRVTAFLASVAGRMRGKGRGPLPLAAEDVASYLRVAPETVEAELQERARR